MVNMIAWEKELIRELFFPEDVSYNVSLRIPLFIKPHGRIDLFAVNLCPYKGFIK